MRRMWNFERVVTTLLKTQERKGREERTQRETAGASAGRDQESAERREPRRRGLDFVWAAPTQKMKHWIKGKGIQVLVT